MAQRREVTIGFGVGQALAVRLDEDQIRVGHQGARDGNALLLATG